MAATSSRSNIDLKKLLSQFAQDFPTLTFVESQKSYWDPNTNTIYYRHNDSDKMTAWSIVHELGHQSLGHLKYRTDLELVEMEVAAWQAAKNIARTYKLDIDDSYIEDCLDTYRDWLHERSTCPTCTLNGVEKIPGTYRCINCRGIWHVSRSRFCRIYRKQVATQS